MTTPVPSADEAVRRIEKRLAVPLPQEYREYLIAGLPWADRRRFLRWEPGYHESAKVVEINRPYHYAVIHQEALKGGIVRNLTIEFMLDVFDKRQPGDGVIPTDAIAVASAPTLETILLFVRGPRRGQVWLKHWKRLEEEGIDGPEDGLHFVAHDFKEFLDKLRDDDPEG